MLPNDLRKELKVAVAAAVLFAPKDTDPIELAKRIVASEHQLIQKVQEFLILDRLGSMITRKKSVDRPNLQLELPGFESLPYRISIYGERTVLREATLLQLKSYRDVLEKQERKHKSK